MFVHTGSLPAAIKAVEATDRGVGELLAALATKGGKAVICADHGNAEQMWDPVHNVPHTSHTLNLVEVFVVGDGLVAGKTQMRPGGRLADIAPTVLALMGLPKPVEMTGQNLVIRGVTALAADEHRTFNFDHPTSNFERQAADGLALICNPDCHAERSEESGST